MNTPSLEFLKFLAQGAGEITKEKFRKGLEVQEKIDGSPVTMADRESETWLRAQITEAFPSHSIFGEEFGETTGDSKWSWILDPIDGTKSFLSGIPLYTILIGVLKNGSPLLGGIYQPEQNEWLCGDGQRAWYNGKKIQMKPPTGKNFTEKLAHSRILTTDWQNIPRHQNSIGFKTLLEQSWFARTWGDGYGYLMLVTGRAEIMIDPVVSPWDVMPLIPVISGAGGVITDYQGGEASSSVVAAHPTIHSDVIEILNS